MFQFGHWILDTGTLDLRWGRGCLDVSIFWIPMDTEHWTLRHWGTGFWVGGKMQGRGLKPPPPFPGSRGGMQGWRSRSPWKSREVHRSPPKTIQYLQAFSPYIPLLWSWLWFQKSLSTSPSPLLHSVNLAPKKHNEYANSNVPDTSTPNKFITISTKTSFITKMLINEHSIKSRVI